VRAVARAVAMAEATAEAAMVGVDGGHVVHGSVVHAYAVCGCAGREGGGSG
jgi:hypothetical protein